MLYDALERFALVIIYINFILISVAVLSMMFLHSLLFRV